MAGSQGVMHLPGQLAPCYAMTAAAAGCDAVALPGCGIGRFGQHKHKQTHASAVSYAADADMCKVSQQNQDVYYLLDNNLGACMVCVLT